MTPSIDFNPDFSAEFHADVLIIGAGGCGLSAALAAADAGAEVVILEQTKTPLGTTSMSTGLIPAAGTPDQADVGIEDGPAKFYRDIMAKNKNGADPGIVETLCRESASTIAWLKARHNIPLTLVDGFTYPGHSARRMYGTKNRTGEQLMAALEDAAIAAGIVIVTEATATRLVLAEPGRAVGVGYTRPDGSDDKIGCKALILATCGFAANGEMLARYIPEVSEAVPHTHPASQGIAIAWGEQMGAKLEDLSAYQGHAGLAAGYGIPILWPTIMEGGFQVNTLGMRFSNEARGYSEQAATVLAQPGRIAWSVFDTRIEAVMSQFNDYRDAQSAGAIVRADTVAGLASKIGVDADALQRTFDSVTACAQSGTRDSFGRAFNLDKRLKPSFCAVRVTGAIFHTQGGLAVDRDARVLMQDGKPTANIFAGGGAARGISGSGADGYLAGNGLLSATSLGKLAGRAASRLVSS